MPEKLLIATLLAAIAASGCNPNASEKLTRLQQDVLKGQLSGPNEDMVVKLESIDTAKTTILNCSGALVAPNLVITARHCISSFIEKTFTCDSNGELVPGSPGGIVGALDNASDISVKVGTSSTGTKAVARGVSIHAADTDTICRNDIAFVVLNQSLDQPPYNLPIAPVRLYAGVQPREEVRVVGYGLDDDAGFGVRHTRSGLTVSKVGSSVFRPTGDNIPPRTFTIDGPTDCMGDSGGPAFSDDGAVIGVFSQFIGDCRAALTVNYFTEVAPFTDVIIVQAFAESGYAPWLEGNSEPGLYGTGGSAGTGGDSSTGGATPKGGTTGTTESGGAAGSTSSSAAGGASGSAAGGTTSSTAANTTNVPSSGTSGSTSGGTTGSAAGGTQSVHTAVGGAPLATGGASHATGGDTTIEIIYNKGPSSGGSCACRFSGNRRSGLGILLVASTMLGAGRRRKRGS